MAANLKVRCKACGQGFRVPSQTDRSAFENPANVVAGKGYRCTKCGQMRVYDRPDHFFE